MKKMTTIQHCCQSLAISVLVAAFVLPHQANANPSLGQNSATGTPRGSLVVSDVKKQSQNNKPKAASSVQGGGCHTGGAFCW